MFYFIETGWLFDSSYNELTKNYLHH